MSDPVFVCPQCSFEIKLTEAISAPILERQRKAFEAEARRRDEQIAQRERTVGQRLAEVEQAKALVEQQVLTRLQQEREKIAQTESKKARESVAVDLREAREQLAEKETKLKESQDAELALRRERRELEERGRQLQIEVDRRIDDERRKIRETIESQLTEQHRMKLAEKDQQLTSVLKQLEEARRRGEQGSQQAQGEALELELESLLSQAFPRDRIDSVPVGQHGGDVLHHVHNTDGVACGTIIWESKNTKLWKDDWLTKLRDDQRAARADLAVLVTTAMPKSITTFASMDGVWVTSAPCLVGLSAALRMTLIELHAVKQSIQGRQGKMDLLYAYLAGPQFKQRIEAVVESYTAMREDLDAEKKAFLRIWQKREKQIERVLVNTVGLHGDVSGIIGRAMPELPSIELKALAAEPQSDITSVPAAVLFPEGALWEGEAPAEPMRRKTAQR